MMCYSTLITMILILFISTNTHTHRYREGMLQARSDLTSATTSAVHLAADQLVELSETHGAEVVEDGDIDELLSWTNALNFEE